MRIPILQHPDAEVRTLEARRRDSVFELLEMMRRRDISPTNGEWVMLQDCLDDITYRMADVYALLGFSLSAAFTRGPHGVPKLVPVLASMAGYEMGMREAAMCPATETWNAMVRLKSPVGDAARHIYTPFSTAMDPRISAASPFRGIQSDGTFMGDLFSTYHTMLSFLTMRYAVSSLFGGSAIGDKLPDGSKTNFQLSILTRYVKWCPIRWSSKGIENGAGQIQTVALGLPVCEPPRVYVARRLVQSRRVILENAQGFGWVWWYAHLSFLQLIVL